MAKKEWKLYALRFTEYNGEQEYTSNHVLYARSDEEAEISARAFLAGWYDDLDEYDKENDAYSFNGGCNQVRKISVGETTKEQWMEDAWHRDLIGKEYYSR